MELDADDFLVEDSSRDISSDENDDEAEEIGSADLLRLENAATALAIHEAVKASTEPPAAVAVTPIIDLSTPPPPAAASTPDPLGPTVAPFGEAAVIPVGAPIATVEPLGATVAAPDPLGPTVAPLGEASPTLASLEAPAPRPEPPRPDAFRGKSEHATLIGAPAVEQGTAPADASTPEAAPHEPPSPVVGVVGAGGAPLEPSSPAVDEVGDAPGGDDASESAQAADVLPLRSPGLPLRDRRVVIALVAALALLCVVGLVIAGTSRSDAVATADGTARGDDREAHAVNAAGAREAVNAAGAREDDVPPPAPPESAVASSTESPSAVAEESPIPPDEPAEPGSNEATAAPAEVARTNEPSQTKARSTQARRTKVAAAPPSSPAPVASPAAAPAPKSSVGTVRVNESLSVIQVDGRYVRVQGGAVSVACGTHKIKAGMGNARVVVVPCGGVVSL